MRAFSTLVGIIFLLVFLTLVMSGMSFLSIGEMKAGYYVTEAHDVEQQAESCIEESLRKLKDDLNFAGGLVALSAGYQCQVEITGDDVRKSIAGSVELGGFKKTITAQIDITTIGEARNFRIINWLEN